MRTGVQPNDAASKRFNLQCLALQVNAVDVPNLKRPRIEVHRAVMSIAKQELEGRLIGGGRMSSTSRIPASINVASG
jgi:hypothetical protein